MLEIFQKRHSIENLKISVKYPEMVWADCYIHWTHKGATSWCWAAKFSKFVPPDALKIHSPAQPVLRFLCKTFSKLLKFALQNTPLPGWFFKTWCIHGIQIKNLCGYKLVKAEKQSGKMQHVVQKESHKAL